MLNKYLEMWFQLYLKLAAVKVSDAWLSVRLDIAPRKEAYEERNVRIRVTAGEGKLIHDEIRTVIGLVDKCIDDTDLPLQSEIQNDGIEITSLIPFKSTTQSSDLNEVRLDTLATGQDEDNANAKVWLDKGNVPAALAVGSRDYVIAQVSEAAFGDSMLAILQDDTPVIVQGCSEDGVFDVEGALTPSGGRDPYSNAVTIEAFNRIITTALEDEMRTLKPIMERRTGADALTNDDIVHFLIARPGEDQ